MCIGLSCYTPLAQQDEIMRGNLKVLEVVTGLIVIERIRHTYIQISETTKGYQDFRKLKCKPVSLKLLIWLSPTAKL